MDAAEYRLTQIDLHNTAVFSHCMGKKRICLVLEELFLSYLLSLF